MAVLLGLFWNLFRPTGCLQCTIVNGVGRSHIRLVYFHREFRCDGWFTITSWLWCIVFTGKWYIQTDRSDFAAWPGPSIWRHVLTSTAGRNGNLPPLGESVMRIIISLPAWCRTIHHTASPALHNAAGHQFACTSDRPFPWGSQTFINWTSRSVYVAQHSRRCFSIDTRFPVNLFVKDLISQTETYSNCVLGSRVTGHTTVDIKTVMPGMGCSPYQS